eukprot:4806433-Pyramimonas_sp.AAC.1
MSQMVAAARFGRAPRPPPKPLHVGEADADEEDEHEFEDANDLDSRRERVPRRLQRSGRGDAGDGRRCD